MHVFIYYAVIVVFLSGMFFYRAEHVNADGGNILAQVSGCVWHGLVNKLRGSPRKVSHWIYGSVGRYPEAFVRDVAAYLKVFIKYIALPKD